MTTPGDIWEADCTLLPHPTRPWPPGPDYNREQLCAEPVSQGHPAWAPSLGAERAFCSPSPPSPARQADPPHQSPFPVWVQRPGVISVSLCDLPHIRPAMTTGHLFRLLPGLETWG